MQKVMLFLLLVVLAVVHVVSVDRLTEERIVLHGAEDLLTALPSPILKIAALDYDGLVSDYLFIDTMSYIGGSFQGAEIVRIELTKSQWQGVFDVMAVVTDLDPYFQDPYYIVNAFLTWDAGMVREANSLLEKGSRARNWDWTMPYFLGFNEFFFLQDNNNAANHLMEASRRPDASPILAGIAARLAFKERKTETAILFLEDVISRTDDENLKKVYGIRLKALKNQWVLEEAVNTYKKKYGRHPGSLESLIRNGIIREIPVNSFGGKYYLDSEGMVRNTMDKELEPYVRHQVRKGERN